MSMGRRACRRDKEAPRQDNLRKWVLSPDAKENKEGSPFVVLGGEFAGSPGRRRFQGAGAGGGEARLQWAEKSPEVRQCEQ